MPISVTAKQAKERSKKNLESEVDDIMTLITKAADSGKTSIVVDSISNECCELLQTPQPDGSKFEVDQRNFSTNLGVRITWRNA